MSAFRTLRRMPKHFESPRMVGPQKRFDDAIDVDHLGFLPLRLQGFTSHNEQGKTGCGGLMPEAAGQFVQRPDTLELLPFFVGQLLVCVPEIENIGRKPLLVIVGSHPLMSEIRSGHWAKWYGRNLSLRRQVGED